ncbi:MAG: TonB-dependent receptor, partial [Bacteroides sp.]|nr:TonB-dependent receptor [Bacteroides sp.]
QRMSNKVENMHTIFVLLFSVCTVALSAQNVTLTGNVTDTAGETVIGASVLEKGTTNGVITDLDGNFTLKVSGNAPIVISYVGMVTQEINVRGKTHINVVLQDDAKALDEVVVIGYGTVSKRDLTGSVASVSAKQLEVVPVSSAAEALTGKLPGVSIMTTDGSPDADIKIRVRGGGSLSQDNSPLYIVDGFEAASISDIAPSEIQSIDVLKDASSTAIYGSKGANGVIIVTTKSGHEGKAVVNFGASFGFRKATKFVKALSPYEYVYYQYEIGSTDYGESYQDLEIWKSVEGSDYQDLIFGRTGNQTQYNVSVSGGSKETKYSLNFNHSDEKSIMRGSAFGRDNINAKVNTNLNQWLSLDFQARLSNRNVEGLGSGADTNESNAANSIVANSVRYRPVEPILNNTDDEESSTRTFNPAERLDATYKKVNTFSQTYNTGLTWKPFKNITARSEFGYTWTYTDTDQAWEAPATQNSRYGGSGMPQAVLNRRTRQYWKNANTITYDNKKLFGGRDKINVMVGHEVSSLQDKIKEMVSIRFAGDMTIDEVLAYMGTGEAMANQTTIGAKETMVSFFGRANYTLNEKYLLTVTMRADGSSKFASGNQWGFFPSAALAWRVSDEAFMKSTQDWLSNLKLRLSFGSAGNNRISSGLIVPNYSLSSNTSKGPYFGGTNATMLQIGSDLYNPDLTWETTITRNLGLDYGFWDNRLSGTLDLYWNTTKDLLMRTKIAENSGYEYQYQNFGKTENKGIELSATAVLVDNKNFNLDFNFNISYNNNRIKELNMENPWQSSNWAGSTLQKYEDFRVEAGSRLGEVWGYKMTGYYTPYDAVNNPNGELILDGTTWKLREGVQTTAIGNNLYPGGLKVECDENGDPIKQRLGNTIAPWTGGFGLNARYKNFDLSAFFNYSIGNVLINGTKLATSFYSGSSKGYNLNNDFTLDKRYTWIDPDNGLNIGRPGSGTIQQYGGAEGIIARLNELNADAQIYNPAAVTTMQLIDYAVEKASFLRVSNISVGYTLPRNFLSKIYLQNARIYVTGYNLFCFTNYSGADPEVDTSSKNNAMTPGVDYAAYPKSRSFVAGINVTF